MKKSGSIFKKKNPKLAVFFFLTGVEKVHTVYF